VPDFLGGSMIVPEIKSIEGVGGRHPDIYCPSSPNHFGIQLYLFIGPQGTLIEELFQVLVCSPSWFKAHEMSREFNLGFACVFAERWDWQSLQGWLHEFVKSCEADKWVISAFKISRYFDW
jgi:hypothetical protein